MRTCPVDGTDMTMRRPSAKYCSDRCKKRAQRGASVLDLPQASADATRPETLLETTRQLLAAVDRLDTPLGASALNLAARIDSRVDTGAGLASLNREWRATFEAATANTSTVVSPMDELRLRREQRRGA